jgi:hypothetical protein
LPTRLLDWTESALVALYFALTKEPDSTETRAVWVLNPFALNKVSLGTSSLFCPSVIADHEIKVDNKVIDLNIYLSGNIKPKNVDRTLPEKPIAINAAKNLRRVSSQKGCFTVHGHSKESIDSYLSDSDNIQLIEIPVGKKQRMKMVNILAKLGIDEEFIFQDLDSLCMRIKREYQI